MSNDDISADIERLSEIRSNYNCFDEKEEPYYNALSNAIKVLANFERPQGKWNEHYGLYSCSECGQIIGKYKKNYCATCGAFMRGDDI